MNRPNVLSAMMIFFITLIVLMLLYFFIDTYVFEPLFDADIISDNIPGAINTLLSYIMRFGVMIGFFIVSIYAGFKGGMGE